MDNRRIRTGYDIELQLKPALIKKLIDRLISNVFSTNKKLQDCDIVIDTENAEFSSDSMRASFIYKFSYKDEEKDISLPNNTLRITIYCMNVNGLWSLVPQLESAFFLLIPDIASDIRNAVPSIPIHIDGITRAELIAVPAKGYYESAIVLIADIDFAKLVGQNINLSAPVKTYNTTEALTFLPKTADYALGINQFVYDRIADAALAMSSSLMDKMEGVHKEIKIKSAVSSINLNTLKITIKGIYDVSKIDSLDLSFSVIISVKFEIGEDGILQAQCEVETELDHNAWYNVLVTAAGFLLLNPLIGIAGIHANSIVKLLTRDMRAGVTQIVKSQLQSPHNYHYCSEHGVCKLHRQNGFINVLNSFLGEPIKIIELSNDFFCQQWLVVAMKPILTFFDDFGATVWGKFSDPKNLEVCNDVTLKVIKYFKDGRPIQLVYEHINTHRREELSLDEALKTIIYTERADTAIIDSDNSNSRSATGKLPMSILSFPVAVQKRNNAIDLFEFDNGLIVKKEDLLKLYKGRVVLIKGVTIAYRNGKEYFTTIRDDIAGNNLSSLPTIDKQKLNSIYYDN